MIKDLYFLRGIMLWKTVLQQDNPIMLKLSIQIIAVLIIILGIVTFPLPIPLGAIFIMIGLAILIFTSARLRAIIRKYRQRNPDFNSLIEKIKEKVPDMITKIIRQTDPK